MKLKNELMVVLSLLSLQNAMARDVFFFNDPNHFIKTDLIELQGKKVIKFAGCRVFREKTLVCTDIAQIPQAAFSEMQNWEVGKQVYGHMMAGGTALLGYGASVLSLGMLSWIAVPFALTGVATGEYLAYDSLKKADVYSENNQNNEDYINQIQDYETFIKSLQSTLKESLDADVADELIPVTKTEMYAVPIEKSQIEQIKKLKGEK